MRIASNEGEAERVEMECASKRGRGRPATITLPLIEEIGRLIAKGLTEEQACLRVGINHSSFRTARHRNPEFETAIKEAQAIFVDEATDAISKGSRGWQGLAWLLERRHGDQFRRNSGLEFSGHIASSNPVEVLLRKPLQHWTEVDVENSVGAWLLLKKWTKEQLANLIELYARCWGPDGDGWTLEQLQWYAEVGRLAESLEEEQMNTVIESPTAPLQLVEANRS